MVEHDVAALIGELLAAALDGVLQDFVHAAYVGAHGDDRRQILQRPLHGVIQAGGHQQKHEKRQNVDAAVYQQHGAGQRHGGDAKLQHHAGGGDEHGVGQLGGNGLLFHGANFIGQAGEVSVFCVGGLEIPQGLDVLLNAVGAGHFHGHGLSLHPILHPIAGQQNGDGHGDHPQRRQRHAPVEGEEAEGDEHGGDKGAEQAGDEVGAGLLQHLAVGHDGAGEVGQIPLAEEGQRQLPQALGQRQTPLAALFIGGEKRAVVLEPCGQQDQRKADDAAAHIEARPPRRGAGQQVADEEIEQPRGQHEGDVLQGAGQHARHKAAGALGGAGGGSLNFFQHDAPSFATFHSTEDW